MRRKILSHDGLQRRYAARLRRILTDLGPCFVKLGQALSIRPDLLPTAVLEELQQLCDAVPSFPTKEALEVMREDCPSLRRPEEVFQGMDEHTEPIAAASLGQVRGVNFIRDRRRRGSAAAELVYLPEETALAEIL